MRILISAYTFYPTIGGLESVVSMLAHEFISLGHEVKVVTHTQSIEIDSFPFEVVRRPSFFNLIKLFRWSNIYFQNNVTLRTFIPLILVHRPWVVAHHGWYTRNNNKISWQDCLKRVLVRFATSISVSVAVDQGLPVTSTVIPNPYRDDLFRELSDVERGKKLIFLGRLVSDKGVDILIRALFELKKKDIKPNLTIVGDGPEKDTLFQMLFDLELREQVQFVGTKNGDELVKIINQHEIMVIPSSWNEPFGVVALEGIACGCIVVGSRGGGLKDAIGPCGETFENNNYIELADVLSQMLLATEGHKLKYKASSKDHLHKHKAQTVAKCYLQVFDRALCERHLRFRS